jgi:radical SAM superfamily enzyme YgiQ (UPF0313 family)
MRVLLVAPTFPTTYWGFEGSMSFIRRRANLPPLGLATVAALLPPHWELRLIDTNVRELRDDDIRWANAVLIGGMHIQVASMNELVTRARTLGVRTVVGGPAPTGSPELFSDADAIFIGEAEGRDAELIAAVTGAHSGRLRPASARERPPMELVPVPRFDLLELDRYASVSMQYSRGCPYDCEFCDVIKLFGRRPRVKSNDQVLAELAELYALGYRGSIFFVDDNFIGHRRAVKGLLRDLARFQSARGYPFQLYTEATINLASDDELIEAMVRGGFSAVFIGIESPSAESLAAAGKVQNLSVDLAAAVDKLVCAGIEVMGGFILGFDPDGPDVFEAHHRFITETGIPMAMVGLLIALPGTRLEGRLRAEGRLRGTSDGDSFCRPNFEPAMDEATLLSGYADLMARLYSADEYYGRCERMVERARKGEAARSAKSLDNVMTFARAIVGIGIASQRRRHFWRLLWHAATRAPHNFVLAVTKAVMGEHLIRYTDEILLPRMHAAIAELAADETIARVSGVERKAVLSRAQHVARTGVGHEQRLAGTFERVRASTDVPGGGTAAKSTGVSD